MHLVQVEEKQLSLRQAVQRQTAAQAELKQQVERVERGGGERGLATSGYRMPAAGGGARRGIAVADGGGG